MLKHLLLCTVTILVILTAGSAQAESCRPIPGHPGSRYCEYGPEQRYAPPGRRYGDHRPYRYGHRPHYPRRPHYGQRNNQQMNALVGALAGAAIMALRQRR